MKIISNGINTVIAVCGRQKNTEGRAMRPSVFMLKEKADDSLLLYNTLTGELLLLDPDEDPDNGVVDPLLIEKWFFVPEDFDEHRFFSQIDSVAKMLAPCPDVLTDFTIFTTTDCNARCFYCYERGAGRMAMSDVIAHDTASFIARSCKNNRVSLHWFGGEPLFNSQAIDIITADLKNAGVEYSSRMISNAYLFDEETVKKAKENWNLDSVQVTLDGTEEVYNNTKKYIYENKSAYSIVLENIQRLLDARIRVSIRLNLGRSNFDDLMSLADDLKAYFGSNEGLRVFAALLYDYVGIGHGFTDRKTAFDAQKALDDKLLALGLYRPRLLIDEYRVNQCMASDDRGVTVLPDGRLGKCEHHIDDDFVGSIYEGVTNTALVKEWKRIKKPGDLCGNCPAFVFCSKLIDKCPSNQHECGQQDRERYIDSLKTMMLDTYNNYKQTGEPLK